MDEATGESWWASESLDELEQEFVDQGDESANLYLRERWLSAMMAVLRNARRGAGLTQQVLAERLGTRQPSVSRLEHDEDTTLGRFIDYLIACGRMPFEDLETAPLAEYREYVRSNLASPRTAAAFRTWRAATAPVSATSPSASPVEKEIDQGLDGVHPSMASAFEDTEPMALAAGLENAGLLAAAGAGSSLATAIAEAMGPWTSHIATLQGVGADFVTGIQSLSPFEFGMSAGEQIAGAFAVTNVGNEVRRDSIHGWGPLIQTAVNRRPMIERAPIQQSPALRALWQRPPLQQSSARTNGAGAAIRGNGVAA